MKRTQDLEAKLVGFGFFCALVLALLCLFGTTASAAVIDDGNQSWIGQTFSFGDVHGGYATNVGAYTSMGANLSLSSGDITNVSADVWPETWRNADGKNYFQVAIEFYGTYDKTPVAVDQLYASQNGTHRGVMIGGDASLGSYQEWLSTDTTGPSGPIWSTASASVQIEPFTIMSGRGSFQDYSGTDYEDITYNNFSYNVYWEGYTTDPTAAKMLSSIRPTSLGEVPEPATIALLACGFAGFIRRRKH